MVTGLAKWFGFYAKAKENLAAGAKCLGASEFNAAANRLYWAGFQAAAWAIAGTDMDPDDIESGAESWNHQMVLQNLKRVLPNTADRSYRQSYMTLKGLREKADYAPEDVSKGELLGFDSRVGQLLTRLGL